jgi:predicted nucleic acid-binding protein
MPTRNKVFIDSNFFIYLFDKDEKKKRQHCSDLILKLEDSYTIVISTQVIKEISSVLLRKFNYPVSDLKVFISQLEKFEVAETPPTIIQKGLDIMSSYQLSFWDSIICATAASANCSLIVSEDMQDGMEMLGMTVRSPFSLTV